MMITLSAIPALLFILFILASFSLGGSIMTYFIYSRKNGKVKNKYTTDLSEGLLLILMIFILSFTSMSLPIIKRPEHMLSIYQIVQGFIYGVIGGAIFFKIGRSINLLKLENPVHRALGIFLVLSVYKAVEGMFVAEPFFEISNIPITFTIPGIINFIARFVPQGILLVWAFASAGKIRWAAVAAVVGEVVFIISGILGRVQFPIFLDVMSEAQIVLWSTFPIGILFYIGLDQLRYIDIKKPIFNEKVVRSKIYVTLLLIFLLCSIFSSVFVVKEINEEYNESEEITGPVYADTCSHQFKLEDCLEI